MKRYRNYGHVTITVAISRVSAGRARARAVSLTGEALNMSTARAVLISRYNRHRVSEVDLRSLARVPKRYSEASHPRAKRNA